MSLEQSQIEKIKASLNNLANKSNKIMFVVPDVKAPAASIYEIYFQATTLKNLGYTILMLTESKEFEAPDFIETELTDLKHISMDSTELTVSPEDLLVIPEIFTNVMEQTKNLPCMRVVLFQSIDNATKALLPGYDWSMFNINNVITTGQAMSNFIEGFFGKGKFRIKTYNVPVPDYFVDKYPIKRPVISILVRNERELDKIVKLFFSKYPQFRWVNFEPLLTDSKPPKTLRRKDFADRLGKNFAALWIDRISSHALFPLECMKVGTIPISLLPDVTPEYLLGADGKPVENAGVWSDDFFQVPMLIADVLRKYLDDEIPQKVFDDMQTIAGKYSTQNATEQLTGIYQSLIAERTDSLQKALDALQTKVEQQPDLGLPAGVTPTGVVANTPIDQLAG